MMHTVNDARLMAVVAHHGQVRKYSGEPYIVHPLAVAEIVEKAGGSQSAVIAAILHDVVEDTDVTLEQIRSKFGNHIMRVVEVLTDVKDPEKNRATRKQETRHRYMLAQGNVAIDAHLVKIADMIHNASDLAENDPDFWFGTCREEMRLLMNVLTLAPRELKDQLKAILEIEDERRHAVCADSTLQVPQGTEGRENDQSADPNVAEACGS